MIGNHKKQYQEHREDLAGEYKWGDTGQLLLIIVFIIGLMADLFLFKLSDSWQNIFPWYLRIIVILPLMISAGYLNQRAHKKIFIEKRMKLMVIKTDVYSIIRHPMYFGSILIYLSFVILSLSLIALMIFVVVVIFYYYLCLYEEDLLITKLEDEYKDYMKNVPMLIPRIKR